MSRSELEIHEYENEALLIKKPSSSRFKRLKQRKSTLIAIDLLISALIATPLTVTYWIATWDVFVIFIYEKNVLLSCSITFVVSNFILWLTYLTHEFIQRFYDSIGDENWIKFAFKALLKLIYVYISSLSMRIESNRIS